MNARIQELALQASEDYDYHPEFAEKFAELIVRECEKVSKNPQWYSESPSDGWRNPIRHVCNVMKKHFGVAE